MPDRWPPRCIVWCTGQGGWWLIDQAFPDWPSAWYALLDNAQRAADYLNGIRRDG